MILVQSPDPDRSRDIIQAEALREKSRVSPALPDLVLGWFGQWRGHPDDKLPARVERALTELSRRSEVLIGWVQAALALLLGVLYLVSPSSSPVDAVFHPVPWALGIYAAFTMLRLKRAYANRLSMPFKILSIVVDISMLLLTIWSFHIQYGQPAAFYLKAPTMLYVFIFIALRALTITPGYVLLTGLAAAAGWLAMLGYALNEGGTATVVTRDYVEYMNSARILIGAEIDRVISILLVTAVLSVSVARARQLLFRAVGERAAADQLSRFFSPEIAERLSRADELLQSGDGEPREAAAMFIDLRGFTKLAAALPPVMLIELLREYQRIAVPIIHRRNGSVSTYMGDGIMVTFGATRESATYCADALRCADELLDALAGWCIAREAQGLPAPGIGVGVDAGTVTVGVIGDDGRLEYAIIGDPVNRAAKLQNQTKAEGVMGLCSVACLDKAVEQGYVSRTAKPLLAGREVAGVAGMIDICVLDEGARSAHGSSRFPN
ncbi:MAG: adenylate/guanylate cyclase domain-containing protein [Novosphingobium sp.]